jgi:hypothetical protein
MLLSALPTCLAALAAESPSPETVLDKRPTKIWNRTGPIQYYADGVVMRTVESTHWHQPLFMIFDSETMPNWFGMPKNEDLASTYSVEYVRAWKRQDDTGQRSLFNGKNLDGRVVKCLPRNRRVGIDEER